MKPLDAVAAVFDKLAELEDARAAAPVVPASAPVAAAPVPAPVKVAAATTDVADVVRAAIGEDVSPDTAAKIAASAELLDVVTKIAAEKSRPTPMGGPSEEKVAYPTSDKKERLSSAFDSWGGAISRHG